MEAHGEDNARQKLQIQIQIHQINRQTVMRSQHQEQKDEVDHRRTVLLTHQMPQKTNKTRGGFQKRVTDQKVKLSIRLRLLAMHPTCPLSAPTTHKPTTM